MSKINYPDTVQKWLDGFHDHLIEMGFFTDHELGHFSEEKAKLNFQVVIGDAAFQSWIKEGEVKIEPRKLTTLLFQVIVKSHLEELKEEGLIDSIEDVPGGEIMWLTNKDKDENKGL